MIKLKKNITTKEFVSIDYRPKKNEKKNNVIYTSMINKRRMIIIAFGALFKVLK
jgi:hypothetical protein